MRIAIVDEEKCSPEKCDWLCLKVCPVNRKGEDCITEEEVARIEEELCIGCGICVNKCPFDAIEIVKTPEELEEEPIHRFGDNGFVLYRLPVPEPGNVIGLLGKNSLGKSTAFKVLSGSIDPNLGEPGREVTSEEISGIFRGTQLQKYFEDLEGQIETAYKPQEVEKIPRFYDGSAVKFLEEVDGKGNVEEVLNRLEIEHVKDRNLEDLSGGELQRVALAATLLKDADIYYFDEPSSYLDVQQRLRVGGMIRELAEEKMVMVVDHDLATLDFVADKIHILYGKPGAYGVVSIPYSTRKGINAFLEGYIKEDNVRIRDKEIEFEVRAPTKEKEKTTFLEFTDLEKRLGDFELRVDSGEIREEEQLGVFGANALGKTTFAEMLAGGLEPDEGELERELSISFKPQQVDLDFDGKVIDFLSREVDNPYSDDYRNQILRPLGLDRLLENDVESLSGGEKQRLAIAVALSGDAELYLLDEPSAFLDVDQRLKLADMLDSIVSQREATSLVIDHDLLFLDYLSERGMVFLGESGKEGHAKSPTGLEKSFNVFLKNIGITFRRDQRTGRPRANKPESVKDREQKESGDYYYTE